MPHSLRIDIEDPSQTSEARREARKMALAMGFEETRAEQVAIVVTEASTNILKHAGRGEILLAEADSGSTRRLECLALDRGPGMSNMAACLKDGYSTGGTPGQGLGAIQRLSNESDFYSAAGKGTLLLARWACESTATDRERTSGLNIGAVSVSKKGQEVCGDSWAAEQFRKFTTILVADGLGHGYEASLASAEAVRILHAHPDLAPGALIERVHHALRSSRGAAVAAVRIDGERSKVTFCGVGNISAQIYSGSSAVQHLVSVNGTLGHQTQRLREFSYPWPENGMIVLHSDGLATATSLEAQPGVTRHDPTVIAGLLYRDFSRGQDDATVVVAKAA